jgi:hypothetical protein
MPYEPPAARAVGLLNEKPLHAALKAWYAEPGDRFEVPVDGYLIDIVRGDLLVEIQTRGLVALRSKLEKLLCTHPVRVVLPIAAEKWVVRLSNDGPEPIGRRKSPSRGSVADMFCELVSFPRLLACPGFSLEVLLIQEEEVRRQGLGRNWRRRGWGTAERRLLSVVDRRMLETTADLADLIPPELPEPFTTAGLAQAVGRPLPTAQKMAYCLRHLGVIAPVGQEGRAVRYARVPEAAEPAGSRRETSGRCARDEGDDTGPTAPAG